MGVVKSGRGEVLLGDHNVQAIWVEPSTQLSLLVIRIIVYEFMIVEIQVFLLWLKFLYYAFMFLFQVENNVGLDLKKECLICIKSRRGLKS